MLNTNPYLVSYHWKGLFNDAYKGLPQHPWPKWRPDIVDQLCKFDQLPFRAGLTYELVNKGTIIFTKTFKKRRPSNEFKSTNNISCPKNDILKFLFVSPFSIKRFFNCRGKIKMIVQFTGVYVSTVQNAAFQSYTIFQLWFAAILARDVINNYRCRYTCCK